MKQILIIFLLVLTLPLTNAQEKLHSPHKASMYSAVLPGLGQIYNKKAWKVPVIYAGAGAIAYAIHFNSKFHKRYKNAYRDWIVQDPENKSYLEFIPRNSSEKQVMGEHREWFTNALKDKKQYYRRYKELSYIGMGALYVLQIIDASVDAHFFNFDVSDDLSINILPDVNQSTGSIGASICLNIF